MKGLAGALFFLTVIFSVPTLAQGDSHAYTVWVDKSDNRLTLKEGNAVVKTYVVATGTKNSTPVGSFKVTTMLKDPTWYKPGQVVGPHDERNHLGTRWIGINKKGYGIHGTTEPEKLGQQVSAGCVRMKNRDVEELFSIVKPGTPVIIQN